MHTDTSTGAVRNQNNVCKVIVLGDSTVGKTSLLYRYCEREILQSNSANPTLGVDYFNKSVDVDGRTLQVGDFPYLSLNLYFYFILFHDNLIFPNT